MVIGSGPLLPFPEKTDYTRKFFDARLKVWLNGNSRVRRNFSQALATHAICPARR
jgi:hypothetical protein